MAHASPVAVQKPTSLHDRAAQCRDARGRGAPPARVLPRSSAPRLSNTAIGSVMASKVCSHSRLPRRTKSCSRAFCTATPICPAITASSRWSAGSNRPGRRAATRHRAEQLVPGHDRHAQRARRRASRRRSPAAAIAAGRRRCTGARVAITLSLGRGTAASPRPVPAWRATDERLLLEGAGDLVLQSDRAADDAQRAHRPCIAARRPARHRAPATGAIPSAIWLMVWSSHTRRRLSRFMPPAFERALDRREQLSDVEWLLDEGERRELVRLNRRTSDVLADITTISVSGVCSLIAADDVEAGLGAEAPDRPAPRRSAPRDERVGAAVSDVAHSTR